MASPLPLYSGVAVSKRNRERRRAEKREAKAQRKGRPW
jgi:hypothetical protein